MYPLGLTGAERRQFHLALRTHRSFKVRVYVMNLDHERLADLSDELEDGQVNIDTSGETSRTATISFVDKGRTLDFDSNSPADGALFANRMLRIEYRVKVDALNEWVEVPIFTGPVTSLDRAGDVVNVECKGKEILAMGAAWEIMQVKKGTPKVDAIRRIMRERGGESRFSLPDLKERLGHSVSLGRQSSPWNVASRVAESMDRQLFYDGAGRLRMRQHPENEVFTFNDGQDGVIVSEPQVSFANENLVNVVWVKGGKPKATRRANETRAEFETRQEKIRGVEGRAVADHSHPLSPFWPRGLGRPDAPRFLVETVENDHIRSEKKADAVAERKLAHRLAQGTDVSFDSLPVPHLEEGDKVTIDTRTFSASFYVRQMSIPLRHDGTQSVGYIKRVSVSRRRPNRRRQTKKRGGGTR